MVVDVKERTALRCALRAMLCVVVALGVVGCRNSKQEQATPPASQMSAPEEPPPPAAAGSTKIDRSLVEPLSDSEFGALVTKLSEAAGEFPSENFVSNETSYLRAAEALSAPARKGRTYIGVGPEQNFSYLALCEPKLAFIVDIRRDNLLLHLLYKSVFERSPTRRAFLTTLLSREDGASSEEAGGEASVDELVEQVGRLSRSGTLEEALLKQVLARAEQLSVDLDERDRAHLRHLVEVFARKGLDLRYAMAGSSRRYPSLGTLLRMRSDEGQPLGFLSTEEKYLRVRALQQANRVVPVVGDLSGSEAMPKLAAELKGRGEAVAYFYTSNVEQYLFTPALWPRWLANLEALPWADEAMLIRVYFDQGRRHPLQRKGERTTTLVAPASRFLERARGGGYRSWWEVTAEVTNPNRNR